MNRTQIIKKLKSKPAKWAAKDAIRELTGDKIRQRLEIKRLRD